MGNLPEHPDLPEAGKLARCEYFDRIEAADVLLANAQQRIRRISGHTRETWLALQDIKRARQVLAGGPR